jgi:hypothetical protein
MDALLGSWVGIADATVIARQFFAGLANGMLLFLVAAGLSLIFGISRIINFGHGALFMLGAYIAFTVTMVGSATDDLSHFVLMLLLATLGMFVFGAGFEVLILRRIYLSFPKIRSGLDWRHEGESSHHSGLWLQSCTRSECSSPICSSRETGLKPRICFSAISSPSL